MRMSRIHVARPLAANLRLRRQTRLSTAPPMSVRAYASDKPPQTSPRAHQASAPCPPERSPKAQRSQLARQNEARSTILTFSTSRVMLPR